MRVGSDEPFETDVRIIAATNREPMEAVRRGQLREDLYYRLDVFQVRMPPLRERLDDIDLLAPHFLAGLNATEGTERRFSASVIERLKQYRWPGNVRELRNVVQRAAIMSDGALIDQVRLPEDPSAAVAAPLQTPHEPGLWVPVGSSIADVERKLIMATLESCGGVRERTADILGISLKTLYNRLREYGQSAEATQPSS